MKRREILVSLGTLATGVVLLASLWGYLMNSTLYHKPGIGKGPYNTPSADPSRPHL